MKLVLIEPGMFTMGQDGPPADYNVKAHAARFDDADWDEKTGAQGHESPLYRFTLARPR